MELLGIRLKSEQITHCITTQQNHAILGVALHRSRTNVLVAGVEIVQRLHRACQYVLRQKSNAGLVELLSPQVMVNHLQRAVTASNTT